jgi:threonine aldolase
VSPPAGGGAEPPIDLRSDTVTRPTPEMRRAMMEAPLGDDVLGDEPTVNLLQERVASIMGKEAACFVPSGTMANQSAIRALTEPGDEVICHHTAHIFHYETGAPAALSGVSLRFVEGERGIYGTDAIDAAIRPANHHFAPAKLIVVENTCNGGGGSVWPLDHVERVAGHARERGLRRHLDGARIWNACAATGHEPSEYARDFDTVSCCFSKGLGAPVGSAVCGDKATIARVFRFRKMFGGAMRQSGLLAAACLYALEHHRERLSEDHANAKRLAEGLSGIAGITVDPASVETNIVYFDVAPEIGAASDLVARLEREGVRMIATGACSIRAVCHLDLSREQIERAVEVVEMSVAARA